MTDEVRVWSPHVTFVADKEEFLPVLCFSPVTTIPPTLHTQSYVHVALTGQKREALKPSKRNYLSEIGQYRTGSSYVRGHYLVCIRLLAEQGISKFVLTVIVIG
jgi:hypothetical protein